MSIEKMKMVQIVGRLTELNDIVDILLQDKEMYFVDALSMIENYSFTMNAQSTNLEHAIDFNSVTTFEKNDNYEDLSNKFNAFTESYHILEERFNSGKLIETSSITDILDRVEDIEEKLSKVDFDLKENSLNLDTLRLLNANDIALDVLCHMDNFSFSYGTITNTSRKRIKRNYSTIPGVVIHLGALDKEEAYLLIYPNKVSEEISRVKDSLNWKEIPMISETELSNDEIKEKLIREEESLKRTKESLLDEKNNIVKRNETLFIDSSYTLDHLRAVETVKEYLARSSKYFYCAGWVSENYLPKLKEKLSFYEDLLINVLDDDEVNITPPTKLKNNFIVRPFEALIHMYGTPNYHETDPTTFFAITYMILFGAMFGDLGQGAVFMLAGLFLQRKRRPNMGGILARVGLSSMIFGLLYGSLFGNEHIIPALLIKPFENINTVLVGAISFGVLLTSISYLIGIKNKLKVGDIEEGLFGKEGVAGFLLFITFIIFVVGFVNIKILPNFVLAIIMIICILLMIVKQPLAHRIKNITPLYKEDVGSYYVEGTFSILEALLGIFSGTISFIRVGAFAINHVGLFMAFETMGKMMGGTGNIIILIIGNIVILGLEGLIVFIQSLRLEYYELFSKYYEGDGISYEQNLKRI